MFTKGYAGGWTYYEWNHGFKWSYTKNVEKNGKIYIIGAGFFPESIEYSTQQLVMSAINDLAKIGSREVFASISNPVGPYVKGDMYLFAYDFEGNNLAHGENPVFINQNLIDLKDSDGKPMIQNFIEIAKSPQGQGWVDYKWQNANKRAFIAKAIDPITEKPILIGGGYYPDINETTVRQFVARAIQFLKVKGADDAFTEFTNKVGEFEKAGLNIFVYDLNGTNLADSENPSFRGQNLLKRKDADGKKITEAFLEIANKFGRGWITFLNRNAYEHAYIEKVKVPNGEFIIGSGFFPQSKEEAVKAVVNKAELFAKRSTPSELFSAFATNKREFIQGDIHMFAYDLKGNLYVNGLYTESIWKNFFKTTDAKGQRTVDNIISTARSGGGWVEYSANNTIRRVYVKTVRMKINGTDQEFVIGSGYYK